MSENVLKSNNKQDSKLDPQEYYSASTNCNEISDGDDKIVIKVESDDGDVKAVSQRENRLTNIIEQLRSQSEMKAQNMESERRKYLKKHIDIMTKQDKFKKKKDKDENIPKNNSCNDTKKKNCRRSLFSSKNDVTVLGSLSYHDQNKAIPFTIVEKTHNKIIMTDDVLSEEDKQPQVKPNEATLKSQLQDAIVEKEDQDTVQSSSEIIVTIELEKVELETNSIPEYIPSSSQFNQEKTATIQTTSEDMEAQNIYYYGEIEILQKEPENMQGQDTSEEMDALLIKPKDMQGKDKREEMGTSQIEPKNIQCQNTRREMETTQKEPQNVQEQDTHENMDILQIEPKDMQGKDKRGEFETSKTEPKDMQGQNTRREMETTQKEPKIMQEQDTHGEIDTLLNTPKDMEGTDKRREMKTSQMELKDMQGQYTRRDNIQKEPKTMQEKDTHGEMETSQMDLNKPKDIQGQKIQKGTKTQLKERKQRQERGEKIQTLQLESVSLQGLTLLPPEIETEVNLQPTITEMLPDTDIDLIRKSLEIDDDADAMEFSNLPSNEEIQRKEKENKRALKKKSYIDFASDEEDFVWDSTSWKDTGDDSTSSERDEPKKKRKKSMKRNEDGKVGDLGRKSKKHNKRKSTKDAKEKGEKYCKRSGAQVSPKKLQPNPCVGKKCGRNCEDISEARRKNIFDHFWTLSSQRKKDWIVSISSKCEVKRKRNKDSTYRQNTYNYFINEGEGRRPICLQFLLKTLDVSQRFIYYTLSNATFGLSKEDARGKAVPKNKTPEDVKDSAINFIKQLPALPSHYSRKDSTKLYLPVEFRNIKNLYRIYKESQISLGINVVGEEVFRTIFNKEFNIGFHVPKKDKCVKCLRFEGTDLNNCPEMKNHLEEKDASKKRLECHREFHKKNPSVLCTSFDLQKVLNTPHGNSMLLFYSRKYTVYNLCFYESITRNGFCYMWGETDGKRGGNEIATIIQKYIVEVDSRGTIKTLILYSDSCPGQNKNKIVLAALHNALLRSEHLQTIQINYLLPGHTEMTVDSIHATIENSTRNNIIWAPSQWLTVFQLARKEPRPYEVEKLNYSDFKNFEDLSDKYFKGNLAGKISKIRVATFKKSSPVNMTVKYSMKDDANEEEIAIISRPKTINQKYKSPLPITTAKFNDLKKLCDQGVIPRMFREEYLNLQHRHGKDVLPETDIEDE